MTTQIPSLDQIGQLTWRAAQSADLPAVHALILAVEAEEHEHNASTLEDLQRESLGFVTYKRTIAFIKEVSLSN